MIRDRLRRAARKAAVKLLHMEFDVEERDPTAKTVGDPSKFDESVIPKLVDGDGDTPGPNHRTDIGRTWVSAQLVSGQPPCFIDIRPPLEVVAGVLPGALVMPGHDVRNKLDRLPAKDIRITVYDQTGDQGSTEVAAWLRDEGWAWARRLQGGYAEWIEHDEPIEVPEVPKWARLKVGDPVRLKDGRDGWVQEVTVTGRTARYTVWLADQTSIGPLAAGDLEA
jgi:rhodanese-related sulfurtransferase